MLSGRPLRCKSACELEELSDRDGASSAGGLTPTPTPVPAPISAAAGRSGSDADRGGSAGWGGAPAPVQRVRHSTRDGASQPSGPDLDLSWDGDFCALGPAPTPIPEPIGRRGTGAVGASAPKGVTSGAAMTFGGRVALAPGPTAHRDPPYRDAVRAPPVPAAAAAALAPLSVPAPVSVWEQAEREAALARRFMAIVDTLAGEVEAQTVRNLNRAGARFSQ